MITTKLKTSRTNFVVSQQPLLGLLVLAAWVLTSATPVFGADGVAQCTPPPSPSDLVGWWSGERNANDITGNGHNGNFVDDNKFVNGEVGKAFSLDGTDDFVDVPQPSTSDLNPKTITVDAWVFVTKTDLMGQYYPSIIGKGNVGGAYEDESYALYLNPTGQVDFLVNVNGSVAGRGTALGSDLSPDTWNFVAGTYDGTTVNVYVNGSAGLGDATHPGTINPSPENDLLIGKADRTTPINSGLKDSFFKGAIDEVELFKTALRPGELEKIRIAGTHGKCKCQAKPVKGEGDVEDVDGHHSKMRVVAERECDDSGNTHFEDDSGKVMDGKPDTIMVSRNMAIVGGPGKLQDGTDVRYMAVLQGNQPVIGANLFSISWTTAAGSVFQRSGALINGYIVVPPQ